MDDRDTPTLDRLGDDACWDLLGEGGIGRLGAVVDGEPVIVPVNYVVDGRTVAFRLDERSRLTAALVGSVAALEIDAIDLTTESGWSVLVRGRAVKVEDDHEVRRIAEAGLRPWAPGPRERVVRIVPTAVSGRRLESGVPAGLWWG